MDRGLQNLDSNLTITSLTELLPKWPLLVKSILSVILVDEMTVIQDSDVAQTRFQSADLLRVRVC